MQASPEHYRRELPTQHRLWSALLQCLNAFLLLLRLLLQNPHCETTANFHASNCCYLSSSKLLKFLHSVYQQSHQPVWSPICPSFAKKSVLFETLIVPCHSLPRCTRITDPLYQLMNHDLFDSLVTTRTAHNQSTRVRYS